MAAGSVNGSYQLNRALGLLLPAAPGDRLDRLDRDVTFARRAPADDRDRGGSPHLAQREVVGQQHRVEVELFEAAQVHLGDPQPVSGDADEADEPLVARRGQRRDRTLGTERDVPLVGLDEVVQLDQVDLVDTHPGERSFELGPSVGAMAFAGLGSEEHLGAMIGEPSRRRSSDRRIRPRCRCG